MPIDDINALPKKFAGPYWRRQIFFVTETKKFDDSVVLIHATTDVYKRNGHGMMLELGVDPKTAEKLAKDGEFRLLSHRVKPGFYYLFKSEDEEIKTVNYEREQLF